MYIRWDKAKPVKESKLFWYSKLVKSYREHGKVKHKILASLGKVSFKGEKIESFAKVKMLIRLVNALTMTKASKDEVRHFFERANSNFKFSPTEVKKFQALYDIFNIKKKNLLEGTEDNSIINVDGYYARPNYTKRQNENLQAFDTALKAEATFIDIIPHLKLNLLTMGEIKIITHFMEKSRKAHMKLGKTIRKELLSRLPKSKSSSNN